MDDRDEKAVTPRGFRIYAEGEGVRVQQSSSCEDMCRPEGGYYPVWIFVGPESEGRSAVHLTTARARVALKGLQQYIAEIDGTEMDNG